MGLVLRGQACVVSVSSLLLMCRSLFAVPRPPGDYSYVDQDDTAAVTFRTFLCVRTTCAQTVFFPLLFCSSSLDSSQSSQYSHTQQQQQQQQSVSMTKHQLPPEVCSLDDFLMRATARLSPSLSLRIATASASCRGQLCHISSTILSV